MSVKALTSRSSFFLLVTATILLQHTAATSSSIPDVCPVEQEACYNDSECAECVTGVTVYHDEYIECTGSNYAYDYEYDGVDWCAIYSASACCIDSYSANDCLGNSAFVGLFTCIPNELPGGEDDGKCSTLTCGDGSGGGVVDDDVTGTDIASSTDDGAVGNGDATATDGGIGYYNGTTTDDGAVANDDGASDGSANTGGTSGAGNSSPSAMLTLALGLAFLSAAPFSCASVKLEL